MGGERTGGWRWFAVDALVALLVAAVAVLRSPDTGPVCWTVACALAAVLLVRRWLPGTALGITTGLGAAAIVLGYAGEAVPIAVALALYPVVLRAPRVGIVGLFVALGSQLAAGCAVLALAGLPLVPASAGTESFGTAPVSTLLYTAVVTAGSWALGTTVRTRRGHAAQLGALRTEQAVTAERLRIARDMHDVVGHNLSLIATKAAVANHVAERHPGERASALHGIEELSRSALREVRNVLGQLRDADPAVTADLDRLVADVRTAGVEVTVTRLDLGESPAGVRICAHRILQEALTNVLRHASPARCDVTVTDTGGALLITVADHGMPSSRRPRAALTPEPRHGLIGIRERVALYGGTVHAEPAANGGFTLHAVLPFAEPAGTGS